MLYLYEKEKNSVYEEKHLSVFTQLGRVSGHQTYHYVCTQDMGIAVMT